MSMQLKLERQREYFQSGATLSYDFRKDQLKKLRLLIEKYELEIAEALFKDLGKSKEESWLTETGLVLSELKNATNRLVSWMKPQKVNTNLVNFPSRSFIVPEPLGVVLIISPWNYPFNLIFIPLIGAIAAGNCAVLKPSEVAPATSSLIFKMVKEGFHESYITCIEGDGQEVIPAMMNNFSFDHVFYTGSTRVGQMVYEMAAKTLTPVTLELGGKSPAVVEADANIAVAAKRIALAKCNNAGQMCVAPDYVLVQESVRHDFINAYKNSLEKFYPNGARASGDYGRIVNEKQFDRLVNYLQGNEILLGGANEKVDLFLEPTLLSVKDNNAAIMQEEIFGPVLPLISFKTPADAKAIIAKNKNPLAFYIFTENDKVADDYIHSISFGGGCINNVSLHLTNYYLPFGGRGYSGIGQYHGKFSFETFSHKKAVLKTPTWLDPAIKYPPYQGKMKILKKLIG